MVNKTIVETIQQIIAPNSGVQSEADSASIAGGMFKAAVRLRPVGQLDLLEEGVRVNFNPFYKRASNYPIVFVCDLLSDGGDPQGLFVRLPKYLQKMNITPDAKTALWPVKNAPEGNIDYQIVAEDVPKFFKQIFYIGY